MPDLHALPTSRLEHKVVFYVPSRTAEGELPYYKRGLLIHALMTFLLRELGSATFTEGKGYFRSENRPGKIDVEDVTLCTSFCDDEAFDRNLKAINQMAYSLAVEFDQESVAVEIDSVMYHFAPTAEYQERYRARLDLKEDAAEALGYRKYLDVEPAAAELLRRSGLG